MAKDKEKKPGTQLEKVQVEHQLQPGEMSIEEKRLRIRREATPALREKLIQHDPAFDPKSPHARTKRIPRMEELDGAVVNIEITRYPRAGTTPIGRVLEILGRPGELGVDTEIIIRKHHLPHQFSAEVEEEAQQRARPVHETD